MAGTTTFNTRISLKYDTYANWTSKNPVLLAGEIAVVVVPASAGAVVQEPAILFKVGDGTSKFSALSFTASLAADVYDWAKASTKPTYSANEITGLADYISGKVEDTDTTYKIEQYSSNGRKFSLYSQSKGATSWTLVKTIEIPEDTLVEGSTNGTVKFNGTDVAVHGLGSAAYQSSDAFEAKGALDDDIATLNTKIGTLPTGTSNVVDYVDNKIAAIPEQTDYTVSVTTSTPSGVAKRYNLKQAATGLDINIDIPKDMVVSSGSVVTNPTGLDAGTYLKLVLANADNSEVYINVSNLIEYVTSGSGTSDQIQIAISSDHKVTATLSNGSITLAQLNSTLQTAINKAHEHSNKTVLDEITSTKVRDWDDAVGKEHTHSNKTVLDGITATNVSDWNSKAAGDHEHDISDINQASGYIVLNCGSASTNI